MARVRWHGLEFAAEPIEKVGPRKWRMKALAHGPRFVPGTIIEVDEQEILEMAAAETPAGPDTGLAELEAALAEERKALPDPIEMLRAHQADAAKKRAERAP